VQDEGVDALLDAIDRHATFLAQTGELASRRRSRLARHTREVVDRALRQLVWIEGSGEETLRSGLERVAAGRTTPYDLAQEIIAAVRKEIGNGHG